MEEYSGYKIAVVDVQYIVANSSEINKLKEEQEQKIKELQEWLDNARTDVEKQKNEEDKNRLLTKYNQEFAEKQIKIREEHTRELQIINKDITEIIEEEVEAQGYDLCQKVLL